MFFKKNKISIVNSLTYLMYILLTILIVLRHFNYDLGQVLYTGDLRIHSKLIAENSDTLFNFRLMIETTPFISLYPILSLFNFLKIEQIHFFIIFLIPLLAFLSMDFILRKYIPNDLFFKEFNLKYFISTSLSFIYVMNPSYFNRIGHWNINYLYIFIPLFFYLCDQFLKNKGRFYTLLILSPIIFYGVSSPHSMVAFTGILFLLIIFNYEKSTRYFLKSVAIISVHAYAISHNFLAMLLKGNILLKTSWEGETNPAVLASLSKNSSFISSLSGTNYYYDQLITHPIPAGAGFIVFLLILFLILKSKKILMEDIKYLFFIVIFLFINLGYLTLTFWFDNFLLKIWFIKDLLWLIKDPNIFYNFLIFFLLLFLVKKLPYQNKAYLILLVFILSAVNFYQLMYSKIDNYKEFFKPIRVTDEYIDVYNYLSKENKRTLWIPTSIYIDNKIAPKVTYFPNFNLWLTTNPEVTIGNKIYQDFINMLNKEVIIKNCQNKDLVSWLMRSNDLYLVVDEGSSSDKIGPYKECLLEIESIEKVIITESITVFKSNLALVNSNDLTRFTGNTDQLNTFLKEKPISLVYIEEKNLNSPVIEIKEGLNLEKIYTPFHPSITYDNQNLYSSVNFISSVVKKDGFENNSGLEFINNSIFKTYLRVQSLVNFVLTFVFLALIFIKYIKKYEHNNL